MAVAALITWVITAGLGFFMLGTWLSAGGARTSAGTVSHFPPPVVFGHFLLAAGGLVLWIIYLFTDTTALAWIAFVDLLVVATLGDVLVFRWAKDRQGAAGTARSSAATGTGPATSTATGTTATASPVEQRIPLPVVAAHGVFAVATLILVLLAALGVG